MNDVFNITNFDVLSDNDNYYFFRGLNNGDNSDLDNNITKDANGNIVKIRTDRSRYIGRSKYNDDSKYLCTLKEINISCTCNKENCNTKTETICNSFIEK